MTLHFPDPVFVNESDYAAMRDLFRVSHFTRKDIPIALSIPTVESFRQFPRPMMAAMTAGGRPIDAFARLFLMHEPITSAQATKALAPMSLDSWLKAGILRLEGDNVFPNMGIAFFDDLWLLHDTRMEVGNTYVMGVAGTTAALANQSIFAPGNLALDLGTGCGVLAFLAAKHCKRVLATDKNPRAIAVARFNAKLNNLPNVDFAVGDLYEPVHAYLAKQSTPTRFDFIYCNPPFVITPSPAYMYRDSGMVGDAIVEAVARGAGPLLNEGGVAQLVCNWMHVGEQPWKDRLSSWFNGSGCDALIFQTRTMSPLDYASIWIEETEKSATPESRWKMLNEWMGAYQQMQLKGVSFGLFTLRKRTNRANFVAFDDAPENLVSPAGPHIAEMLACRDYLAALDATGNADEVLANANLWFSPHLRVDQHLRPAANTPGSSWKHERDDIRLAHGYGFPKVIDQRHMDVLMALDGSRSVKQVVESIAATTKAPASALLPLIIRLCRGWLERAYVLPPGYPRG